jgi:pectate lyase
LYTAPGSTGSAVVTAASGSIKGQATITISSSSVLFSDNFESGAGQWTVDSGTYYLVTLSNGNHRLEVQNYGDLSRIVAGSSTWTNYSYQGTITWLQSYGGSLSLMARVQDDNHFYFFGYSAADGAWFIARKDGPGVTTMLAVGAPFTAYYNQDYVVQVNLSGNSLSLYVGGVLQVSATDSKYASGKIGFTGTWAVGTLDNVTVTSLTGPSLVVSGGSRSSPGSGARNTFTASLPPWSPSSLPPLSASLGFKASASSGGSSGSSQQTENHLMAEIAALFQYLYGNV